MKKRVEELDALRGLAAISVIICHMTDILPPIPKSIAYSPLRILWAGHEAVILFFILSGYVLSIPFLRKKEASYKKFLFKRFFRIYLPYYFAIIFAIILKDLFYKKPVNEIGWANSFWTIKTNLNTIFNHFYLIGDFNTNTYDPAVWSLVHEMRVSIIFPLLMIFIIRLKWFQSLLLAFMFNLVGIYMINHGYEITTGYLNSYAHTIHYISIFIVGALAAKHEEKMIELIKKIRPANRMLVFALGILFYTMQIILQDYLKPEIVLFVREWFIAIGAYLIILCSLSSKSLSGFLTKKYNQFFGKISYSLYLLHLPIILSGLYLLHSYFPEWVILLMAIPIIFLLASFSWKYIEMPSIKLGKLIVKK